MTTKSSFLYPTSRYYGEVKPENLVFNANLQEISHKVTYLSNLAANGKISLEEAYERIESLMVNLDNTKNQLGVGDRPFG
jgi:sigma54-dependent transcription regulator